jgi:alkanesulfonate monooxygenase SsuD/methylene tetrahydromethanopterin reductase-like flavin-dependent oxidoreductase (luciferase family)
MKAEALDCSNFERRPKTYDATMRFSLMTEPQLGGTYDDILAAARWAEQRGLWSFARSDHYYSNREPKPAATDAFTTLAGLARETSTIRLAVLVTPVTFRHPSVIAKTAATLDQMSGGRFDLGVGTGWMQEEHDAFGIAFPDWSERFDRLTECLDYLSQAFTGTGASYTGTHYTLDADVEPTPVGLRMIVGGTGKLRTPSLAGARADEYNHIVAPATDVAPKIGVMRRAAESADRDPNGIDVSMMGPVLVGRDEEEYRRNLDRSAARRGLDPSELEGRLRRTGVPIGFGDRLEEQFAELDTIGIDTYYIQWIPTDDLEGLDETHSALSDAVSDL